MKKIEYILYAVALIILLVTILAKAMLWAWAGPFLIMSYTVLAFIFMFLSWLIYTTKDENKKSVFFLYGTIPLGFTIGSLVVAIIGKLQHWSWYRNAFVMTIFFFIICLIIFIVAFLLVKNTIRKDFIQQMIIRVFVFIGITLLAIAIDFDRLVSAISSPEANEQREKWEREATQSAGEPLTLKQ